MISSTYGVSASVLTWRHPGGRITAGLPVIRIERPFRRTRLVALPFTDHCPPLLTDEAGGPSFGAALRGWVLAQGCALEIRDALAASDDSHLSTVGFRHVLDLEADSDAVLSRLHRNRIQKRIRRARELGVEVELTRSPGDLSNFYRLHCETRRRQGVPVQPWRFIENVGACMLDAGLGFLVTASYDRRPIASGLFLAWNRRLIYKFGASDRKYWKLGANFLVHWTAMEWGCKNGFLTYDFGRTDLGHESLREFKAAWGGREVPLVYSYLGSPAPSVTHGFAAAALAQVVKRSPVMVCRGLGELLYRYQA